MAEVHALPQIEIQCAVCEDTWVSGQPGVCEDCGVEAMLAPEGESDWAPCFTCWLDSHNATHRQPAAGPSSTSNHSQEGRE